MRHLVSAFAVAITLAGCATPYQPMGFTGGVAATRIDETTVEIAARGNGYTDRDTISHYALRKAAEETLADGFDLFQIVNAADRTRRGTYYTPGYTTSYTTANATALGNTAYGTATTTGYYAPSQAINFIKPGETLTIHMIRGAKGPDAPAGVFDAHEVVRYMTPPATR